MPEHVAEINGLRLAYRSYGPDDGPLVLCAHGFPDSPETYRHLAPALADAGFRVVTPWLRGYPPSQVVRGPYQIAAHARDLLGFADALSPGRPVSLVGHDWGAHSVYGASTLAPDRVARAVVLAVAPTRVFRAFLARDAAQQRASWYQYLFQLEALCDTVVPADGFAFVDRLWADWSPGWTPEPEVLAAARETVRAGYPAALDYYRDSWQPARHDPALAADQQRIFDGPITVPMLLLHGLDDGCILPGAIAGAGEHFAGAHRIQALPGVGHFLHLEDPATVHREILTFLQEGR